MISGIRLLITGSHLPGRHFCGPDGTPVSNVHVGVQIRRDPHDLVRGDAPQARWEIDLDVVERDGSTDFRGPAVQGRRGDRFVYLTWGNVEADGRFEMFRRAKLMLDRVDPDTVRAALRTGTLAADVDLTGDDGGPRCARVDPPSITWSAQ